jgi:hypothetical protein
MVKIKVFKSYNEISNMKSAKFSNDQSSIFDTGASKSGTSDSKILTNLEKCEKVTVQGAFGPPCIPSLKGKLGFSCVSNTRVSILCCLLKLLKNPESKKASGWSTDEKMVNPTMISLWLTSWSSQRVFLTMTSWSNVKGYWWLV